MLSPTVRVALLHLDPLAGALERNRRGVRHAVEVAAAHGARWVVTPEFATTGYGFAAQIGLDWIEPQPDAFAEELLEVAVRLGVHVLLSVPERDRRTGKLHNSVLLLRADGGVQLAHRKVCVVPGPAESWASPGESADPVEIDWVSVGVLVCADACSASLVAAHVEKGAEILISPAAWYPGEHGPAGEWEARSAETGCPVFVCNRTGEDGPFEFWRGESLVVVGGERTLCEASRDPAVFLFDWDLANARPKSGSFERIRLREASSR